MAGTATDSKDACRQSIHMLVRGSRTLCSPRYRRQSRGAWHGRPRPEPWGLGRSALFHPCIATGRVAASIRPARGPCAWCHCATYSRVAVEELGRSHWLLAAAMDNATTLLPPSIGTRTLLQHARDRNHRSLTLDSRLCPLPSLRFYPASSRAPINFSPANLR